MAIFHYLMANNTQHRTMPMDEYGYYYILGEPMMSSMWQVTVWVPKEIEEAIGHHPEVAESAVVASMTSLKVNYPLPFAF